MIYFSHFLFASPFLSFPSYCLQLLNQWIAGVNSNSIFLYFTLFYFYFLFSIIFFSLHFLFSSLLFLHFICFSCLSFFYPTKVFFFTFFTVLLLYSFTQNCELAIYSINWYILKSKLLVCMCKMLSRILPLCNHNYYIER